MDVSKKALVIRLLKLSKYVLVCVAGVIVFLLVFRESAGLSAAVTAAGTEFGISTYPSSGFLSAPNMAPGDLVSAPLTVKNEGDLDFSYDITANMANGSDLYYDVLKLEIRDSTDNIVFAGQLKELSGLVLGILGAGGTQVFNFSVGLPEECGNEYQGLGTEVSFVLNAKEHPPFIEGGGIVWDPPLERPDVDVRNGGMMQIKFHLVKDGAFDTVKRGIDLIITGVGDDDRPVEYVFTVTDGTLEWEEHGLNKPHYRLMFDAQRYPVKYDTYYTATVKYGDQVLGSTRFKSGHR